VCLGSQTRFKASASAKCSGALKYARSGGSFGFSHAARSRGPARVCTVCTSLYGTSRFGGFPASPPPDSSGRGRGPRIVQRLFSARLPVQVFLFIGVRSRPGGPEAVHGAAPGGSRTRSPQQSESRAVSSPSTGPGIARIRVWPYTGYACISLPVTYHLYMAASHTTDPVTFDVVYLSFETATRA
jgi:hypothetical protein